MAKKEFDVSGGDKPPKLKKKKGKKAQTAASIAVRVEQRTLRELAFRGMKEYATEVNLERSVPDLVDGLKPVQRRIAYMANVENTRGDNIGIKTARLMGSVMGRLHPHAEATSSAETMMHQPTSLLTGDGGWGSLLDNAAAARYTHCTLSNYGWSFFDPDYINKEVTPFVPNFDDTYQEPVYLPAMLPNVLLNGTDVGIGVGVTTKIPAFTPESIIPLLVRIFKREELQVTDFYKGLKFAHKWGGHVVASKKNKEQIKQLMEQPTATVEFESELIVDRDKKTITIKDWPPGAKILTFVEKVRDLKETADISSVQGVEYFIECRKDYNLNQFDAYVEKVQKLTRTRQAYKVTVTKRSVTEKDGVFDYDTKLMMCSVPELILLWCKERLELERKSLDYRVRKQQAAIAYSNLLIDAANKVDIIIPIIRNKKNRTREEMEAKLKKVLKCTEEQVTQVLNLRLQQLSRLDQDELEAKLKAQKAELKVLEDHRKKPRKKIIGDLANMMPLIQKDRVVRVKRKEEKLVMV